MLVEIWFAEQLFFSPKKLRYWPESATGLWASGGKRSDNLKHPKAGRSPLTRSHKALPTTPSWISGLATFVRRVHSDGRLSLWARILEINRYVLSIRYADLG